MYNTTRSTDGCIYVIKCGKYCKIGFTRRSVRDRIKELQTGCPIPYSKVWHSNDFFMAKTAEHDLHKEFKPLQISLEWFLADFDFVVNRVKEHEYLWTHLDEDIELTELTL